MKFIELNKNLKQHINSVYNIKGEDIFLIKQAINNIKSTIIKDLEEFNFVRLAGDKLRIDEVNNNLLTLPIGNEYRLVVIDYPNSEVVKFINNFDFNDSSTILVCINAEKLSIGELIDCTILDRADITKYILNNLAKNNLSIEERALDYIIDATNSNMSKIHTELDKIIAYANTEEKITIDMATNLVSNSHEYVIYMLTGAIDDKDYAKYQTILSEMSKSQSINEIYSYIGKYFKRMQYIAVNKDDDSLSKVLNIKPYAIKMSRQKVAKNGVKYYINLYQKYISLDYKIKSGEISVYNALYELIF